MKIITAFIITLLLPVLAIAQPVNPAEDEKYVTDSTWFYLGDTFGEDWFNFERYHVTERDDYGNFIKASTMALDTVNFEWYEKKRFEAEYSDSVTRSGWYSYTWDDKGNNWKMSDSVYYNENGVPLISWYKVWDPFKFRFSRGSRVEYSYEPGGLIQRQDVQRFDTLTGGWTPDVQQHYMYNAQDLIDEFLVKTWDAEGFWRDSMLTVYTYNEDDDLSEETRTLWTGTVWANDRRTTYSYSAPGILREKYVAEWNHLNQSWKDQDYFLYSYDDDQRLSEVLEKYWDDYESRWVDKNKTNYTYTAAGKRREVVQQFYDPINQYWFFTSKYNYTYDEHGNRVEYIYRFWDEQNAQWLDIYKEENYWSLFEPFGIDEYAFSARIFPNPASEMVQIRLPEAGTYLCIIQSLDGKTLAREAFHGRNQSMDVSALKPGIYLISLQTGGKFFTTKLIIK